MTEATTPNENPATGPGAAPETRSEQPETARDWLSLTWSAVPERQRAIIVRRAAGDTLEEIGSDLEVSRERVRQLHKKADDAIAAVAAAIDPGLMPRLALKLGDSPAAAISELDAELPPGPADARKTLLRLMGIHHPHSWDGDLVEWWTRKPDELSRRIAAIVELAPLSHADMLEALEQVGLSYLPPVTNLLSGPNSKLIETALGWCRPARASRDLAFLYLQAEGAPRTIRDIAAITNGSEHAIRETMRREKTFSQVRPEGTWALTDWRVPGSDNRYSSAEETVIEIIRELGPVSLAELRYEVAQRYPVSDWRINQCLSSAMIGLTPDGLYDLAERGARPIEDTEPKRPSTIEVRGNVVGIRLDVNHDLLRGSGIRVNRWLTWHLGLRLVPSLRTFELNPGVVLTVKRNSSNAQISSLRTVAQALDVVDGCTINLVLNTEANTAKIYHGCTEGSCPACV